MPVTLDKGVTGTKSECWLLFYKFCFYTHYFLTKNPEYVPIVDMQR